MERTLSLSSAFLLVVALLSACSRSDPFAETEQRYVNRLQWLTTANAAEDFDQSAADGNLEFIGIYGYSIYFPGLREECLEPVC